MCLNSFISGPLNVCDRPTIAVLKPQSVSSPHTFFVLQNASSHPYCCTSYYWPLHIPCHIHTYLIDDLLYPSSLFAIKRLLDLDIQIFGSQFDYPKSNVWELNSMFNFYSMKTRNANQYFHSNHLLIALGLSCPLCIPSSSHSFRMRPSRIVVVDTTFPFRA